MLSASLSGQLLQRPVLAPYNQPTGPASTRSLQEPKMSFGTNFIPNKTTTFARCHTSIGGGGGPKISHDRSLHPTAGMGTKLCSRVSGHTAAEPESKGDKPFVLCLVSFRPPCSKILHLLLPTFFLGSRAMMKDISFEERSPFINRINTQHTNKYLFVPNGPMYLKAHLYDVPQEVVQGTSEHWQCP